MKLLMDYTWPGNVRELERVIQRCLAWSSPGDIDLGALPPHVRDGASRSAGLGATDALRAVAARHAQDVLRRCGGNKRLACQRLGISYHTLQAYLAQSRRDDSTAQAA